MSELANLIKLLRGNKTAADIVRNADVSRETFRKIEAGEVVKLSTIKKISDYLGADQGQWHDLIIAWCRMQIPKEDVRHIQFIHGGGAMNDSTSDSEQILKLALQLDTQDRKQIIKTMTRPEVMRSLPSINNLWETVKRR